MIANVITRGKIKADPELSEQQRYRLLADHAIDLIWTMTPEGRFTYVSPSVQIVHGMTPEEFMQRPFDAMFTPESLLVARKALAEVAARVAAGLPAEVKGLELQELRKDKSVIWTEVNAVSVYDRHGRFIEILGITRDISKRKKAEEALRQSEERLRLISDNARDVVWTMELDGRITHVSPAIRNVRDITPEEAMRQPLEDIHTPESAAKVIAYMQALTQAVRDHQPLPGFRDDLAYYRKDGSTLWTEVIAYPVHRENGRVEIIGMTRDMSERKKAEQLIRENQTRLAEAERAAMVGELAGGIAHNFNNLLMVINGNAEMLARTMPGDDARRQDLEAITEAGLRAATLTQQLLAFGRRQALMPMEIDLQAFVTSFLPLVRNICGSNIALTVTEDNRAGIIFMDQQQLKQAILNLIFSARDAMPGGGNLQFRSGCRDFKTGDPGLKHGCEPGRYCYLAITDQGAVIDPEKLAYVFQPFYAHKHLGRGTDLGLASVEGTVGQSRGFVEAVSSAKTGNTFTMFLPWMKDARRGDEPVKSSPEIPIERGQGERVLLVDDDHEVRRVTTRLISKLGYQIIQAESGEQALAIAGADLSTFDAVVTDVVMPGMSGKELALRLREMRDDLPVLFISGYSPDELFPDGLPGTTTRFLAKPFTYESMAAQLKELGIRTNRP